MPGISQTSWIEQVEEAFREADSAAEVDEITKQALKESPSALYNARIRLWAGYRKAQLRGESPLDFLEGNKPIEETWLHKLGFKTGEAAAGSGTIASLAKSGAGVLDDILVFLKKFGLWLLLALALILAIVIFK